MKPRTEFDPFAMTVAEIDGDQNALALARSCFESGNHFGLGGLAHSREALETHAN